ncbi:unnamed protein product, partial [Vitis vinifera]|uniref:Uncharacterized protein n=1 Tax=Vitis vinifera TaxID=29760 RepID=D7TXL8_VITVI
MIHLTSLKLQKLQSNLYIRTLQKPRFQHSKITWELLLRYSLFPMLLLLCSLCVCLCLSLLFMLEHNVNLGKNY